MSVISDIDATRDEVQELHSGDRMSREQFHRIYTQMPEDFKAELIGGVVYVASPLKRKHGTNHLPLGTLLFIYEGRTPGTESGDNATVILGDENEPQPDLYLRILPDWGGQSGTTDEDYIDGAPEFVAEIALSSHSIDLHAKRAEYLEFGVLEYLVVNLRERRLHWFDLKEDRELSPDEEGVLRLKYFPGLWIDGEALIRRDHAGLLEALNRGLATEEHRLFVRKLAEQRSNSGS